MDMDPPDDALAAAIGHGNEVSGVNNDVGNSAGEDMNEYRGEESEEEASLPKPKSNRIYNTVGFRKRMRCISRHNKGKQKQKTHDFSFSRADIGIHNANAQKIDSALVGDHQLRYSPWSPTEAGVNRDRISLKMELNNLQISH